MKLVSFEQAKSTIINSALGKALGLAASTVLETVASKIASVVNRGAWTGSITTANGKITIPAGYHNGGGYVQASGLYVPPKTLSGSATINVPGNTQGIEATKMVTFSSPFTTTPKLSVSLDTESYMKSFGYRDLTRSGFTLYFVPSGNTGAFVRTISWRADA